VSPLHPFVRQHRFSTFVALTFVLTWVPWLTVGWLLRTGRPPAVTTLVLIAVSGRSSRRCSSPQPAVTPVDLLVVVRAVVVIPFSWYGTDRLASKPLPEGGTRLRHG